MCLGGKTPEAPVNKPAYAPEDSWKHFETSQKEEEVAQPVTPTDDQTQRRTSVPQVKPSQKQIRM